MSDERIKSGLGMGSVGASKPVDDNWKHRSQRMGCNTCMWYVPKLPTTPTPTLIGRCRRYAPSHVSIGWPVVFPGDWCGEHKLDEEKT